MNTYQPYIPPPTEKRTPVTGIISLVLGAIAFMPFYGIVSIPALLFGIVALFKRQWISGLLGSILAIIMMVTSPSIWLIAAAWIMGKDISRDMREQHFQWQYEAPAAPVTPESSPDAPAGGKWL